MSPALRAAIDAAEDLAWRPTYNMPGSVGYHERKEAAERLCERLAAVTTLSANASPQLWFLLVAMRRVAGCSFANRRGEAYYERDRTLGVRIAGNGAYQVIAVCPGCGTQSQPLSHKLVTDAGVEIAKLDVLVDYRGTLGRCSHRGCEREAVEDHHFAPRAIFGDEADDWPRALLCTEHHREWHARIAGAAIWWKAS